MLQARVNFKGVEKSFFLSCCLQGTALKLVSEMFFFWLRRQPCLRLLSGIVDFRGPFGSLPG